MPLEGGQIGPFDNLLPSQLGIAAIVKNLLQRREEETDFERKRRALFAKSVLVHK